jgi:hypothetical protein
MQKVTKFLKEKMNVDVNSDGSCNQIEAVHRINTRSEAGMVNGARPIIVRFASVETKVNVLKARRKLKGQAIYINEDLCRDIQALFNRARNHRRVDQAWTWNGAVFVKDYRGEVYRVPFRRSLDYVLNA